MKSSGLLASTLLVLASMAILVSSAQGGEIYWTDYANGAIRRANRDGSHVETIVTGLSTPTGIALDMLGGKVYWTDRGYDRIQRANLDGSDFEDLVYNAGLVHPGGIAVDSPANWMYWVDASTEKIQRARLDGTGLEDVVSGAGDGLSSIALDSSSGKMYWTHDGGIRRADLNGANPEDILLATEADWPWGLALDVEGDYIYWSDQGSHRLRRSHLDGSSAEDLVTGVHSVSNIALDLVDGKVYWTIGGEKISRCNLDGTRIEDVLLTTTPYGIDVVPEPCTAGILYFAAVFALCRRRKS